MIYPKDLVTRAEFEYKTFERCAADTCLALISEVQRLRGILAVNSSDHSHECIECYLRYTPAVGESEDCPGCGCNGKLDE